MDENNLDILGIMHGTNKSSMLADYLDHYERIFRKFRPDPINVIEIGIQNGASLRMWEDYFEQATIVGIDIARVCKAHERGRVVVRIGSQDDPGFLINVASEYPPTIVIDDGSHRPEHIISTFGILFPALSPGGIYTIEDLRGHYSASGEIKTGPDGMTPISLFHDWSASLMSGRPPKGASYGLQKYLFSHIDSVEFVGGAVTVRKKSSAIALHEKIEAVERSLAKITCADSWGWFAQFILRSLGPVEVAERAARRAIELDPSNPLSHHRLSLALDRKGDLDGAKHYARQAATLAAGTAMSPTYAANMTRLEAIDKSASG